MMKARIIITILLAIFLVVFTVQNSDTAIVKLLYWQFEIPRALLILICICIGILIGVLIPKSRAKPAKEEDKDFNGMF
jgi:uncharacterized integral membrane protein